jgi:Kinesin motor domain
MELEIQDLSDRMFRSNVQNKELQDEVRKLSEEVITASHHAGEVAVLKKREMRLEALVKGLNAQLFEAKGYLIELEESHDVLEETNTELYLVNTDLEALNVDLEDVNEAMKDESLALREENSILDDKIVLSKQYGVEFDEKYQEIQNELKNKTRQLSDTWESMKEQSTELNEKNLLILEMTAEKAMKKLEFESLMIQYATLSCPSNALACESENIDVGAMDNSVDGVKVITRLKCAISDLAKRSQQLTKTITDNEDSKEHEKSTQIVKIDGKYVKDEKEEVGIMNSSILTEQSHLITLLTSSVDTLQVSLQSYKNELKNVSQQVQTSKLALINPEIEGNQLGSNIINIEDEFLAQEIEFKSAIKEGGMASVVLTPIPHHRTKRNHMYTNTSASVKLDAKKSKNNEDENGNYCISNYDNNNNTNNNKNNDNNNNNTNDEDDENDSLLSEAEWTLEPLEDWEIERAELLKKCQAYREEIEDVKAAAATHRQALLHDQSLPSSRPLPLSLPPALPLSSPHSLPPALPLSSPISLPLSLDSSPNSRSKILQLTPLKDIVNNTAKHTMNSCTLYGSSGIRATAENAIVSNDIEKLKAELKIVMNRHDHVRTANAVLLKKLQAKVGNIQVCCRTRPPSDLELAVTHSDVVQGTGCKGVVGKVCVDISDDDQLSCYDKRNETWKSFAFDRVWPLDATQEEVFSDMEPLLLSVTEGYNTCLLAYGQTGSGKTFTMNGYGVDYGVSYRTMQKIFEVLEMKKNQALKNAANIQKACNRRTSTSSSDECTTSDTVTNDDNNTDSTEEGDDEVPVYAYTVTVSMMQIYNEQVYDLLGSQGPVIGTGVSGLDIRQVTYRSVQCTYNTHIFFQVFLAHCV